MNIHNISKSSLYKYIGCGYSYDLSKNLKTRPSNSVNVSGLVKGIIIHRVIELISEGQEYDIKELFLENVSIQITRGLIKLDNYYDLLEKFGESEILDTNEERYTKYQISWGVYEAAEFEYKDKLNDVYNNEIERYIEPLQSVLDNINCYGEKTEIKHDITFRLDDDNEIHISSIFDKIYKMKYDDLLTTVKDLDIESVVKSYESLLKDELVKKCEELKIEVVKGDIKKTMAIKIADKLYPELNKDFRLSQERRIEEEKEILKENGYNENDLIDVIADIKTSGKTKSEKDISGLMDHYIYSAVYYAKTGRIPVFKIINISANKSNVITKEYNIFITKDLLSDFMLFFMVQMNNLFLEKFYTKNLINNWKCTPVYCEYYNLCRKDKLLISLN